MGVGTICTSEEELEPNRFLARELDVEPLYG